MGIQANSLRSYAADQLALQYGQGFLWAPVCLAFGIGAYFSFSFEPSLWWGLSCFAAALVILGLCWRNLYARLAVLGLVLISLGFFSAQLRTQRVHAPLLLKETGPVEISGRIEAIEDLGPEEGSRIILSDIALDRPDIGPLPDRVRLRHRKDEHIDVGQRIRVLASLMPSSPPVLPGGFDFQRYLYFQGVGAVGFTFQSAEVLEPAKRSTLSLWIEDRRRRVAEYLSAVMEPREAAIAQALLVGKRGAINEADTEAMRDAGLAHLLAISGLHIGLCASVVFFAVRLGLVLVPGIGLRWPIKKIAALAAFAAAIVYMALAGSTIPTQRAVMMTGLVLFAILLDRAPFSMRLVAFAALVVLLLSPESLLSASFQMSFAAVAALIGFYEWLKPLWLRLYRNAGIIRRIGLYFLGVCITTVVASLATAPFALFHFQQTALYGVVANFVAVPLTALVIMPLSVLAALLVPTGFQEIPLKLMEYAIGWILKSAHFSASLPNAIIQTPVWPLSVIGIFSLGCCILLLVKGHLRFISFLFFLLAPLIIINSNQYDGLISSSFKLAAFSDKHGSLWVNTKRNDRFSLESWEQIYGLPDGSATLWPKEGGDFITCDDGGCRLILKDKMISVLDSPASLAEECGWADLIVVQGFIDKGDLCANRDANSRRPLILSRRDGYYKGAVGILVKPDGIKIDYVESIRGKRPWAGQQSLRTP